MGDSVHMQYAHSERRCGRWSKTRDVRYCRYLACRLGRSPVALILSSIMYETVMFAIFYISINCLRGHACYRSVLRSTFFGGD